MSEKLPYSILTKRSSALSVPSKDDVVIVYELETEEFGELDFLWDDFDDKFPMALDIETNGLEAENDETIIIGLGLATSTYSIYINAKWKENGQDLIKYVLKGLQKAQIPMVAYNLTFDGAFTYRYLDGLHLNWSRDAYAAHRHLAGEGFVNQRYGLKNPCQTYFLGWDESGDVELDEWLIEKGYFTRGKDPITGLQVLKAKKGEMWRAPVDILGYYCALDAYSTYWFNRDIIKPAMERFPVAKEYNDKYFLLLQKLIIEQQLRGMMTDIERLENYREELAVKLEELELDFMSEPSVLEALEFLQTNVKEAMLEAEPIKFKKNKPFPKEVDRLKKDGSISKNWMKWVSRVAEWERYEQNPEITKQWLTWKAKLDALDTDKPKFSLSSGPDKQWLFYDYFKYPVILTTKSGAPAVDAVALKGFGEPGKRAAAYLDRFKELSYVDSLIDKVNRETGLLHTKWKTPGTKTGRLAGGGGLSLHQQPKTAGYLTCYQARPGFILVSTDISALEPHVLTQASRDPAMWKLYGPGSKANDVYIFTASQIKNFGEPFRECGYDPDNPTKEAIGHCKKEHKLLRAAAKKLVLSGNYGAGVKKMHQSFSIDGYDFTFDEVKDIHRGFWELYSGIKKYSNFLVEQHRENGGFIINPIGHPVAICDDRLHDAVNRCFAPGTLVRVKDHGWVPIEEVTSAMLVWDDEKWVKCDGGQLTTTDDTVILNDVGLTDDHEVVGLDGEMHEARFLGACGDWKCATQQVHRPDLPSYSWSDVRRLGNQIIRSTVQRTKEALSSVFMSSSS